MHPPDRIEMYRDPAIAAAAAAAFRYDATKVTKDFTVGDRVGYYDGTFGPTFVRRGTVTKIGRKHVHIALDHGNGIHATGGRGRAVIGVVTTDQALFPGTITLLTDEG